MLNCIKKYHGYKLWANILFSTILTRAYGIYKILNLKWNEVSLGSSLERSFGISFFEMDQFISVLCNSKILKMLLPLLRRTFSLKTKYQLLKRKISNASFVDTQVNINLINAINVARDYPNNAITVVQTRIAYFQKHYLNSTAYVGKCFKELFYILRHVSHLP